MPAIFTRDISYLVFGKVVRPFAGHGNAAARKAWYSSANLSNSASSMLVLCPGTFPINEHDSMAAAKTHSPAATELRTKAARSEAMS